ncbi:hypothetical protein HY991_00935 [Candidatus Micrarchaeota archaeon]|nr:hypothetical protein [Candidatus Micrarchaeota archaeon]
MQGISELIKVKKLEKSVDERGWFVKMVDEIETNRFGVIIASTCKPGFVRGNHYHKITRDWACVLEGRGLMALVDVKSGERMEIKMGDDNFVLVEIPPFVSHGLKNIGEGTLTFVEYSSVPFKEKIKDLHNYPVID